MVIIPGNVTTSPLSFNEYSIGFPFILKITFDLFLLIDKGTCPGPRPI